MIQFWALIPLRLALGLGMMQAGFPKLFVVTGRENIAYLLSELGLPIPHVMGWIVGLIEFMGGLSLLVGVGMAIAAGLNALSILTLLLLSWGRGGLPDPLPGGDPFPDVQLALLILAGMLTLAIDSSAHSASEPASRCSPNP